MLRPYHDNGSLADADHILDLQHQVLDRRVVRVDLTRQPPDAGRAMRIDREAADRHVAPSQGAAHAAERQEVAVQQHRHGARSGHTGAASSGSDNEPPGTIIGKTFASCSITSSTSAGPGAAFACRNASVTSPACRTRHPGMPYASASFT